ncbi:MAG: succinate dehydrogenase assembly factor 2 [Parvibaculales bacterium]
MSSFSSKLDEKRKKLYFRSCHRGIKEMDIIFSKFAETVLADISEDELSEYERILELPDTDLFAWATGRQELPEEYRSPLLDQLLSLEHMKI